MTTHTSFHKIRSEFIEKTGVTSQAQGMPRIAGRIFGTLIFDGAAVSFSDLATSLQVSRASISTSVRILEERGLIKRTTRAGERQDYFELSANPYITMLEGVMRRNVEAHNDIKQIIAALPQDGDAAERLNAYAAFYATTVDAISVAIERLCTISNLKSGSRAVSPKGKNS